MKGIVLAGGTGSRLWPITRVVSKQLLPVYDKPMIYYPISTLMLAGIREILIITTPDDQGDFQKLLGDGSNFGVSFNYISQPRPDGIAQALIIGEDFLNGDPCLLILGDNIFHGVGMGHNLTNTFAGEGAHIFTYEVSNPSSYGILTLDSDGIPDSILEKPINSHSNLAVTGLYFLDKNASNIAKGISPSERGELEITSVLESYLSRGSLRFSHLSRGAAWLDTGTINAMHDAATYVRVLEERTGLKIACLEEVAIQNGWLEKNQVAKNIKEMNSNNYIEYLKKIIS